MLYIKHKFVGLLKQVPQHIFDWLQDYPPREIDKGEAREEAKSASACDAVLIIDKSYSMGENDWKPSRHAAAKEAALAFVDHLAAEQPTAHVAIVAYSQLALTCCSLTHVTQRKRFVKALHSSDMKPFGSTNITSGLKETLFILRRREHIPPTQVVLLTDGDHNEGRCPNKIAMKLRKIATLECVGIGGRPDDVNEDLLKDIASKNEDGSPRYRWIGQKQQLVQHFQELAGRITRI